MPPLKLPSLRKISQFISSNLEAFFYWLGLRIGKHPWFFIAASVVLLAVCCTGLVKYRLESRPDKLWIASDSSVQKDIIWLLENSPPPVRYEFAILKARDVLTPEVILELLELHDRVERAKGELGKTWNDTCYRLPVVKSGGKHMVKGLSYMRKYRRHATFDGFFDSNPFENFDAQMRQIQSSFMRERWTTEELPEEVSEPMEVNASDVENEFSSQDFISWAFSSSSVDSDPSLFLPKRLYCAVVESLPQACWEQSLLEIWNYDRKTIRNLTKRDIVDAVNSVTESPVFGTAANYTFLLGGVVHNSTGHVVSATGVMTRWFASVNYSDSTEVDLLNDMIQNFKDPADRITLDWEGALMKAVVDRKYPEDVQGFVKTQKDMGDSISSAVKNDFASYYYPIGLLFIMVYLVLCESSWIMQRPVSTAACMTSIGMSVVMTVGLSSLLGYPYTPMHHGLILILFSIGVDDSFVVLQYWRNLEDGDRSAPLHVRIATTLRKSGVAITVTSFTDALAFALGSTTIIPAFNSFFIYAFFGTTTTYVLQILFFLSCFTLEQRRIEQRRDPLVPCRVHKNSYDVAIPARPASTTVTNAVASKFTWFILSKPSQVCVVVISCAVLSVNAWGMSNSRQEMKVEWLFDANSQTLKYDRAFAPLFPPLGEEAFIYIVGANYSVDMPVVEKLLQDIRDTGDVQEIEEWYTDFKEFVNRNFEQDVPNKPIKPHLFPEYLRSFLFSSVGARHQKSFEFDGQLECSKKTPDILLSRIPFRFRVFSGVGEHVPALQKMQNITDGVQFQTPGARAFTFSLLYVQWESDAIIYPEMIRNMLVVLASVFVAILFIIANVKASVLVMICLFLSLVCTVGTMSFCDLAINAMSCMPLIAGIGLSVDCSVHVAHAFLSEPSGDRTSRAGRAVSHIGPAVFNGVTSTIIPLAVAMFVSNSYILLTSAKVIIIILMYGLFHGVVLLPVVLSWIGPDPYVLLDARDEQQANAAAAAAADVTLEKEKRPLTKTVTDLTSIP